MSKRLSILLLVATLLFSCAPKALREAKEVVAQADSLRAAGQMYTDSARLAESYTSLHAWRYVCGDEYAHACYHYGRLLREKENPVEAMQCFINASHARTRDYHILGRAYSNMGDIAHWAGEFPLAYDMYERSGQIYLRNGDTLLYYYDLNNMAFELAEQGKKEESYAIIQTLEKNLNDNNLLFYQLEIQAVACKKVGQLDSVLYYTSQLLDLGYNFSSVLLNRAQAYSLLGKKDSAVYYANLVLSSTNEIYEQTNALYILTNDDETKDIADVRETASERADSQKIIEKRKSKIAQAVQLLEQDINRKPNFGWLYAVVATLLLIGSGISLYVYKKRQKHQLLSQHILELENKTDTTIAQMRQQIEERCLLLIQSSSLKKDLQWNDYETLCHFINQQFYFLADKLQHKGLTEKEIRLCILSLINCSYDTMADMLIYAPNGVGKFKLRVAKKLGTTAKKMREFLIELAIEG